MEPPTIDLGSMFRECMRAALSSHREPVLLLLGPAQMEQRLKAFEENTGKKADSEVMKRLMYRGVPIRKMQADGIALVTQP